MKTRTLWKKETLSKLVSTLTPEGTFEEHGINQLLGKAEAAFEASVEMLAPAHGIKRHELRGIVDRNWTRLIADLEQVRGVSVTK